MCLLSGKWLQASFTYFGKLILSTSLPKQWGRNPLWQSAKVRCKAHCRPRLTSGHTVTPEHSCGRGFANVCPGSDPASHNLWGGKIPYSCHPEYWRKRRHQCLWLFMPFIVCPSKSPGVTCTTVQLTCCSLPLTSALPRPPKEGQRRDIMPYPGTKEFVPFSWEVGVKEERVCKMWWRDKGPSNLIYCYINGIFILRHEYKRIKFACFQFRPWPCLRPQP